jgi:hypothetical protein
MWGGGGGEATQRQPVATQRRPKHLPKHSRACALVPEPSGAAQYTGQLRISRGKQPLCEATLPGLSPRGHLVQPIHGCMDTWSSPFTVAHLNVGLRHLVGSLLEVVPIVLLHRPDILFLGNLVTSFSHWSVKETAREQSCLKVTRPGSPYTWKFVGVYQHIARSTNRKARSFMRSTLNEIVTIA